LNKKEKEENVKIVVKIPKSKKEMIYNVVAKSSYNNASELIRAGIDKELNLQIYKDNLDIIIQELNKIIDYKLDGFIKSQRKLYANNVRISALNTYVMGEVMKRVMGDDLHSEYIKILNSAREKANYFVNRKVEDISKEELLDFYNIGGIYRNE
jgi:Arc/MetJ-type ribon-helix-helix transcriptional regulator